MYSLDLEHIIVKNPVVKRFRSYLNSVSRYQKILSIPSLFYD